MPEENWRETLSDDLKGNESLSTFEDVESLAKSYIETKALVGSGLRFPTEEASDDAKKEFLTKVLEKSPNLMMRPNFEDADQSKEFFRTLGMPEETGGYESTTFENLEFDESKEQLLRGLAHEAGLTTKQYKAMAEGMLKSDYEALQSGESKTSEEMSSLRQEWGMAWDERKGLANKVRETFFGFIPEAQMDAKTIKALHAVGVQMGNKENSGGLGDHRDESTGGKMTPSDALGKIDDIMNNREHAYWIAGHPQHQKAIDDMIELRKMADPTAGTTLPRVGFGA